MDENQTGEASFGEELRREREMREISIREISDSTKISSRFLEAIEAGDLSALPAPVFTRGFIREYANYLGVEGEDIVDRYMGVVAQVERRRESEEEEMRERISGRFSVGNVPAGWKWLLVVVLALIVLGATVAYLSRSDEPEETVEPATEQTEESVEPPEPPAEPVDAESIAMTLEATSDSWINLRIDEEAPIDFTLQRGNTRSFEAEQKITLLTVGNAGGVEVTLNGVELEPLGRVNQVVRDRVFDLEDVNQLLVQQRTEAGGDASE
ncbi:MAG: helix-turn-helix domain-containing protein [Thermoanaerobaculia bacterium]|nr:helix-turn-helix domain-containing protein [Thermoanaerobaculia bacterium]